MIAGYEITASRKPWHIKRRKVCQHSGVFAVYKRIISVPGSSESFPSISLANDIVVVGAGKRNEIPAHKPTFDSLCVSA